MYYLSSAGVGEGRKQIQVRIADMVRPIAYHSTQLGQRIGEIKIFT